MSASDWHHCPATSSTSSHSTYSAALLGTQLLVVPGPGWVSVFVLELSKVICVCVRTFLRQISFQEVVSLQLVLKSNGLSLLLNYIIAIPEIEI